MEKKKSSAQMKYDKVNTKQIMLKFNKKTDKDILDFLESLENKQGFIKKIIRENMKRE